MTTTITVGVATYPQDGKTVEEVIRSADRALYAAKEEGRNRVKALDSLKKLKSNLHTAH